MTQREGWAVVLAGGEGARLRALTRLVAGDERPKQYCRLLGPHTLLAATGHRLGLTVNPDRILYVVSRHHETLGIADFARAVGWHPNYAMARFKAATGMTIGEYRTRQRVAHAQRLLVTTRRSILDIGLEVGFGSVSRFHAAFRAQTGMTPAVYRRTLEPPRPGP